MRGRVRRAPTGPAPKVAKRGDLVRQKLKALEALQAIDVQILELTRSGRAHPKRLGELEAELSQARAAVDAPKAQLDDNQRQRDELEQAIQKERDKIRKWEARLTEQRTPREYTALAREVDIARKSNQNMQEDMLVLLQAAEGLEAALIAQRDEFRAKEVKVAAEMKEIREKMAAVAAAVKELETQRAEPANACDANLLRRYNAIRAKRGIALAPVVGGTCQGCQITLAPQLYNTLVTNKSLETCPSCHRIIYIPESGASA